MKYENKILVTRVPVRRVRGEEHVVGAVKASEHHRQRQHKRQPCLPSPPPARRALDAAAALLAT